MILQENPKVTIFYLEDNKRKTHKLNAVKNFKDTAEIGECEYQMGLKKGKLLQKLNEIGSLLHDTEFIREALDINDKIFQMSASN